MYSLISPQQLYLLFHWNWDKRSLLNQSNLVILCLYKIELSQVFDHPQNCKLMVLCLNSVSPQKKKPTNQNKTQTSISIFLIQNTAEISWCIYQKHWCYPSGMPKRTIRKAHIWAVWEKGIWCHFYSLKCKSSLKKKRIQLAHAFTVSRRSHWGCQRKWYLINMMSVKCLSNLLQFFKIQNVLYNNWWKIICRDLATLK